VTEEEVVDKVEELRGLDANDRCDQCGSQAYVLIVGLATELIFCAHHFNKIEKTQKPTTRFSRFLTLSLIKETNYLIRELGYNDRPTRSYLCNG